MSNNLTKKQRHYLVFKRLLDILGSLIGIILCLPLIWWWVFIINLFVTAGHPIFRHKRLGKNKKEFMLIKFRSMKLTANPNLAPSDMNQDVQVGMETKFGNFLRKTSLDETLQLFNILAGHMSFIGPRPGAAINEDELVRLREQYTPNAFDVKPGLSGWAQTRMNRQHDPAEKAYHDHIYVSRMSFSFDLKIFFYTILKIFGAVKGR